MSLSNIDITKINKLSLKDIRLPDKEAPIIIAPTDEEINYSKLIAEVPLFKQLVNTLNLVSTKTGERIKEVDLRLPKLIAIAQKVIEQDELLNKQELIERIARATNVDSLRAERGINLMVEAGVVILLDNRYKVNKVI
jgi:hypothetical protein